MTMKRRYFKKHLTDEQQHQLLAHIEGSGLATDIELGKHVDHNCSVVFFDLCDFTRISWSLANGQVIAILQALFGHISTRVAQRNGMIDKYPGDGVVAFFPRHYCDTEDLVVEAALDCVADVMSWFYGSTDSPANKSAKKLNLSVGVDAGFVSIAHVGSSYHSELILLGKQVNCASKCEQMAGNKQVIVGDDAAKRVRALYSRHFRAGPDIDLTHASVAKTYKSYIFDWEPFAETSIWIDKPNRRPTDPQ